MPLNTDSIAAEYVSYWAEGPVHTACKIHIPNMLLEVTVDDDDESAEYEHHERDEVNVTINGTELSLEAEDGELTDISKLTLTDALSRDPTYSKHFFQALLYRVE